MEPAIQGSSEQGTVSLERDSDAILVVRLAGSWRLRRDMPGVALVDRQIAVTKPKRVTFEASGLTNWDSALVAFIVELSEYCHTRGIEQDRSGLQEGLRHLVELAEAVPEKKGARVEDTRASFLTRVGEATIARSVSVNDFLAFLGELVVAIAKFLVGRARYRRIDFLEAIQQAGAEAVGIVSLIAFLIGVILAFMGAVQLQQFGASIYVADLVGIGMVRDMGAMMTAIIMAGRTGAAYAAKLGTMKVTQEIDALTTMGVSPLEFLVLPRVMALVLMMPLLTLFANMIGIFGGMFVGITMLGLTPGNYMRETISTLTLTNLFGGLLKGTTYGVLIALAGCLRGFQCGNSSSAVGDAATQAVVTSIVMVVVACGIYAVVFNVLGI
jgi:phospholipid/cholesterol/gamma-HCH transport system permease protein